MSPLLDAALVTAALAASALYALLRLGPKSWRRRWGVGIGRLAERAPAGSMRRRLARALAGNAGADACGGCGDCGSAPPAGDVRIPVGRIGRRR